jgi:outer membrane protein insertion porin family
MRSDTFFLVLAASLLLAFVPGRAAAQGAGPKLLMLPFVVHTSEAPEYVRGGLSDMLGSRFSRIGAVELEREDDVTKATSNLETALAAGRKAGADYVLFGSFTRFGKGASLDVQCAPVAGGAREPLREIFVHSGSIGEIIPDLDELAGKVSRFARGEIVTPGPSPSSGSNAAIPSGPLADLARRVATLEAELAALRSDEGPREYGAE